MKCSCGSILPENAKFCGKCGKSVIRTENLNCLRCGNILLSGAKFCGKCGEPVYKAGNAKCTRCGNALVSGTKFCGKCGLAVSSSEPAPKPAPTPVSPTAEPVKQWVEPLQRWLNSQISNKRKVKQILIIVLVIGLCLTFTGLAGKIMMGGLASSIKNADLFPNSESDPIINILNRSAGKTITELAISIIKNDPSGFVEGLSKMASSIGSMAGDSYGIGQAFISLIAEELFYEARTIVIEKAGLLWPLLQIMAYYSEMLTIGLIALIIAAALLFLLDGKLYDIWRLNMQNIVYIGCVWSVLVIVASIIVCFAI